MSDIDLIRERLSAPIAGPQLRDSLGALARVESRLNELETQLECISGSALVEAKEAAEAERDEALRRLETTGVVELHERCEKLHGALLDLIEFACRMPGYSLHPQTERAREVFEETE